MYIVRKPRIHLYYKSNTIANIIYVFECGFFLQWNKWKFCYAHIEADIEHLFAGSHVSKYQRVCLLVCVHWEKLYHYVKQTS